MRRCACLLSYTQYKAREWQPSSYSTHSLPSTAIPRPHPTTPHHIRYTSNSINMSSSFLLGTSLFAAYAMAVPLVPRETTQFFALDTTLPSNSTFTTFKGINAADGALWVTHPTNQYCPEGITCPTGLNILTSFYVGVDDTLFLNENSNAVQQVYASEDGLMTFTSSTGSLPPHTATQGPFCYQEPTQPRGLGLLTGPGKFMACAPTQAGLTGKGWYRVFNDIPNISAPLDPSCFEIFLSGVAEGRSNATRGVYAVQ